MSKNLGPGREMIRMVSAVAVFAAILAMASPSLADQSWKSSSQLWGRQDRCAREAFRKFPDYTPEGNAQRERELQQCLAAGNLPPRVFTNTPAPSPPPPAAGSE